ncbi:uncharacterized protein [Spinacia oleracea]|uniref:Reverse transcriptase zinc-binding domain-containing protein n=1 Tax=Spinacia oleracea TaxID=3562 RepID=A0A9R0JKW5_SPIOL|nr:uncharacterized protein LOC110777769 [Spinacia oleracea]
MHKAILAKANLAKRGLHLDESCSLCNNEHETLDHMLKDCSFSDRVWRACHLGVYSTSPGIPIQGWIKNILKYLMNEDGRGDERVAQFTITLWAICTHGNDIIFKGITPILDVVMRCIEEFKKRWEDTSRSRDSRSDNLNLKKVGKNRNGGVREGCHWKHGAISSHIIVHILVDAAWKSNQDRRNESWVQR